MNRPLVPAFLKKLDKKLLINKPNTWSTRVHLLVYYSILFCIAVGLFAFVSFNDPRENMQSEVLMMFTFLLSFIGLVVWLIYLLRFNVFKRFGEDKTGNGIKTFLLFFIGFFFLVLPNYIPMIVESWKANMKYSSRELVKDANRINELIVVQNKEKIPVNWNTDTLLLVADNDIRLPKNKTVKQNETYDETGPTVDTVFVEHAPVMNDQSYDYYNYVDKYDLSERLSKADSSLKLNDSLFVIARCPDLEFIYANKALEHANERFLSSKQLYDSIVKGNISSSPVFENELKSLLEKYRKTTLSNYDYYAVDNFDPQDYSFNAQIEKKYPVSSANSGIYNISDKKYTWDMEHFPIYFRVIFYCSFVLSILLFIFRHSTVKTFFLSVLTVILLMIFTGLVLTLTYSSENAVLGLILFYYIMLVIVLLVSQSFKVRTLQGGISLNLVTAFCAFIPLFCVFYYYEYLYMTKDTVYYTDVYYKNKYRNMLIAEIAGVLLFLILLEPVFKKLFRKWYALPEN